MKRQKVLFKKVLFLNTRRMLQILGYKTGDNERKKVLWAINKGDKEDIDANTKT